jgi:rRNA-processing protein FCF1
MLDTAQALFAKYRQSGLLIDTNILLLYVVGLVNRDRIARFKRTQTFTAEDYDLLVQILKSFSAIVTTPNILTEVNSLANQLGEPERSRCMSLFGAAIGQMQESFQASDGLAQFPEFPRFGLTDCSLLNLARNRYLVLTDDLRLTVHLQSQGIDTINFNNIRPMSA